MESEDLSSLLLSKYCSNLQSEDRRKRKEAIEELQKEFLSKDDGSETQTAVFHAVEKYIWKCFYDKAEAVRDAAISFMNEILDKSYLEERHLMELIPILHSRLGDQEVMEPSEEVRLRLVTMLSTIIEKYSVSCQSFVEEIVFVLSKTLIDSYPKIRKESCRCTCLISSLIPRYFYEHSIKLVKPILSSFNHQHFRLRVAAIETLGNVVKFGHNKHLNIQEVFGSLAERLFDSTPAVRSAVAKVIGDWLVNLPDRYSYFTKLIPIILSCLCDELSELREEAWSLWSSAGEQYMQENDDELKEKMQFLQEKPDHYPKNVERPNLGCRTLVQRNTCQVVPALSRELEDWKNDIRVKSAQLLCWIVLHDETNITQHTEGLLLIMYKVCNQTDLRIVDNVEKAAEYIAYFVPPDSYLKLVLPVLEDACSAGHLCVLSALIRGSEKKLLTPYLVQLTDFLSQDNVSRSRESVYHMQLLKCCEAILDVCEEGCALVTRQLFVTIITVMAVATHQEVVDTAQELFDKLCLVTNTDREDVYKKNVDVLFDKLESTVDGWTPVSYDRFILQLLLQESGAVIGLNLDRICGILCPAMKPETDPTVRLKLFTILSTVLSNTELNMKYAEKTEFDQFLLSMIQDVIIPNLVWHAGRTAEALRTAAVACLCTTLIPAAGSLKTEPRCNLYFASTETIEEIFKILLPLLLNSIEDCVEKTRLFSLKCLDGLVYTLRQRNILSPDHINQMYPILSKRLDDVSDDVRAETLNCLKNIYENLPTNYDAEVYRAHLQLLYNTMIIHLDDHDEDFQEKITNVIKVVGSVAPKLLHDKLNSTRHQFRNKRICDDVMEHLKQFSVSS